MREKDLRNLKIKSFSLTKKILGLIQVFIKYLIKCREGRLKRGKQDIFVCSGDTETEVLKEAVDVIRKMVDVNTVYEVVV